MGDNGLVVRAYEPGDLDAVIGIFIRSVRLVAARDYNAAQIDAWSRVERTEMAAARSRTLTWVAVLAKAPVGFTDLAPDGHLDMMYVDPDHQRIGVATALLEVVECAARGNGLERLFTAASITARPFFERRHFHVIAAQLVESRGETFTNFRMERVLTTAANCSMPTRS